MDVPNTFVAGTTIRSADVNANFQSLFPTSGGRTEVTLGGYLDNDAVFNVAGYAQPGQTSWDAALAIAQTLAGAVGASIYFPSIAFNFVSNVSLTVPVTIAAGATLSPIITATVTFSGPLISPPRTKILGGAGTFVFNPGSAEALYPEWWGITGTADDVAINAAIVASARQFPIHLAAGRQYNLASQLVISEQVVPSSPSDGIFRGVTLRGISPENRTVLYAAFGNSAEGLIRIGNDTATSSFPERNHTVENILFAGPVANLVDSIQLFNCQQSKFRNLRFSTAGHGVYGRGINLLLEFDDCYYQVDTYPDDKRSWSRANAVYAYHFDAGTYNGYAGANNVIRINGGWLFGGQRGVSFQGAGQANDVRVTNVTGDGGPVELYHFDNVRNFAIEQTYAEQSDASCLLFANLINTRNGRIAGVHSAGGATAGWKITGSTTADISIENVDLNNAAVCTIDPSVPAGQVRISDTASFTYPSALPSPMPVRATQQDVTYYVNVATGSDSLDGRSQTVSGSTGPFQTIQAALNVIPKIVNHNITIAIAAGDYSAQTPTVTGLYGSGAVTIQRNGAGTVTIGTNNGVAISRCVLPVTLLNLTTQCNLNAGNAVNVLDSPDVTVNTVVINYGGTGSGSGVVAGKNSRVFCTAVTAGTGTVPSALVAVDGGYLGFDTATVSSFGTTFRTAARGGLIVGNGTTTLG